MHGLMFYAVALHCMFCLFWLKHVLCGCTQSSLISDEDRLAFQQAVVAHNKPRMRQLLRQKSTILQDDFSMLHYCVSMSSPDYLKIYLTHSYKPNLNPRTIRGETPLMLAFLRGHQEMIHLLLKQSGLDVHAVDSVNGWSTLMYAVQMASLEQFKQFLNYQSTRLLDINHQSRCGKFVLDFILDKSVVKQKLDLFLEYANGRLKIPNVATLFQTMYITSPRANFAAIWRQLTPETKTRLIQDQDKFGTPVLCLYYDYDDLTLQEWLKTPGIDVNVRCSLSRTPLMRSVINGEWSVVNLLLSHSNIQVNLKDEDGKTALIHAHTCRSKANRFRIIQAMLQHRDIDATLTDKHGRTGLDLSLLLNDLTPIDLYRGHMLNYYSIWVHEWEACRQFCMDVLVGVAASIVTNFVSDLSNYDRKPLATWLVHEACPVSTRCTEKGDERLTQ